MEEDVGLFAVDWDVGSRMGCYGFWGSSYVLRFGIIFVRLGWRRVGFLGAVSYIPILLPDMK